MKLSLSAIYIAIFVFFFWNFLLYYYFIPWIILSQLHLGKLIVFSYNGILLSIILTHKSRSFFYLIYEFITCRWIIIMVVPIYICYYT